jgi:hypothetical protein
MLFQSTGGQTEKEPRLDGVELDEEAVPLIRVSSVTLSALYEI